MREDRLTTDKKRNYIFATILLSCIACSMLSTALSGAFGSAIFVGIVNMISNRSDQMNGMRVAFFGLTILGMIEVLLALVVIKKEI